MRGETVSSRTGYTYEDWRMRRRTGRVTIGPIVGGLILVWLGVTFYLQQINAISSDMWWAYFLAGLGGILVLQGLLRYLMTHRPVVGSFIGGAVLIAIGLTFVYNYSWGDFWPLIIMIVGLVIFASAFAGRRTSTMQS